MSSTSRSNPRTPLERRKSPMRLRILTWRLVSRLDQSTKMASQWLQNRLIELKVQATDADRELQKYKSKNNIIDTQRGLLDQQQLSDLNTQLIDAKTATAEAKARLERIQQLNSSGIPDATVTDALNNSVITRLRAQYLDIAARAADITSRVGEEHKAVSLLNKQMEELRNSIRSEERRIADAYESDYQIAKARRPPSAWRFPSRLTLRARAARRR